MNRQVEADNIAEEVKIVEEYNLVLKKLWI